MAIALRPFGVTQHGFSVSGYSLDFSGGEILVAAPGAGKAIVLQSLVIVPTDTAVYTFSDGIVSIGPLSVLGTINSTPMTFGQQGLQLDENAALTVTTGGAGEADVMVRGFYADV